MTVDSPFLLAFFSLALLVAASALATRDLFARSPTAHPEKTVRLSVKATCFALLAGSSFLFISGALALPPRGAAICLLAAMGIRTLFAAASFVGAGGKGGANAPRARFCAAAIARSSAPIVFWAAVLVGAPHWGRLSEEVGAGLLTALACGQAVAWLFGCAARGQLRLLIEIARSGTPPSIDGQTTDDAAGLNALMRAAALGDELFVSEHLSRMGGAQAARATTAHGKTALMLAAEGGHAGCVQILLPASDAAAQTISGGTALSFAAEAGHTECVKAILAKEGGAVTGPNRQGRTALMMAAFCGQAGSVELLLPQTDAGLRDENGHSALSLAALRGRPDCVALLLDTGDALGRDALGCTALMAAVAAEDVLEFLRLEDASEEERVQWMRSDEARRLACARLLAPLSDLSAVDPCGKTAMELANHAGREACAEFLRAAASERRAAPGPTVVAH